jgi:hypothetical protein
MQMHKHQDRFHRVFSVVGALALSTAGLFVAMPSALAQTVGTISRSVEFSGGASSVTFTCSAPSGPVVRTVNNPGSGIASAPVAFPADLTGCSVSVLPAPSNDVVYYVCNASLGGLFSNENNWLKPSNPVATVGPQLCGPNSIQVVSYPTGWPTPGSLVTRRAQLVTEPAVGDPLSAGNGTSTSLVSGCDVTFIGAPRRAFSNVCTGELRALQLDATPTTNAETFTGAALTPWSPKTFTILLNPSGIGEGRPEKFTRPAVGPQPLAKDGWQVRGASGSTSSASLTFDGSNATSWTTSQIQSANGLYLQIDLGASRAFSSLRMASDPAGINAPGAYSVYLSNSTSSWGNWITGRSPAPLQAVTDVSIGKEVTGRYLTIHVSGSKSPKPWTLAELTLFGSAPVVTTTTVPVTTVPVTTVPVTTVATTTTTTTATTLPDAGRIVYNDQLQDGWLLNSFYANVTPGGNGNPGNKLSKVTTSANNGIGLLKFAGPGAFNTITFDVRGTAGQKAWWSNWHNGTGATYGTEISLSANWQRITCSFPTLPTTAAMSQLGWHPYNSGVTIELDNISLSNTPAAIGCRVP